MVLAYLEAAHEIHRIRYVYRQTRGGKFFLRLLTPFECLSFGPMAFGCVRHIQRQLCAGRSIVAYQKRILQIIYMDLALLLVQEGIHVSTK